MKTVLAMCALTLSVSGVSFTQAAAQPTSTPIVTATSDFGSSQHPGDQVQYTIDVQNAGEGYATYLIVIQTPTNLTLGAPLVTCVSTPRCAIDEPTPPAANQPTAFVRMPGGAHETITVTATIVAAGPFSVAIATAQNASQVQDPTPVTTLQGDAVVETTNTNANTTTTATNGTPTQTNSVPNVPPERARPVRPNNPLARWLRNPKLLLWLGLAAAALVTLVTSAVAVHSMRRAHWQKLLGLDARVGGEPSVSTGQIPQVAPSVRLNVTLAGGAAGPRGPIRIRRVG